MRFSKLTIALISVLTMYSVSSCGNFDIPDQTTSPASNVSQDNQQSQSISVGYIVGSDGEEAVDFYDNENGNVILKMFEGDAITVYSINGEWAKINYGGKDGYVQIKNVSFTKPEKKETVNEVVETESKKDEGSESVKKESSEQSVVNNEIKNEIQIVMLSDNDGFQYADPIKSYPSYTPQTAGQDGYCNTYSVYIYSRPDSSSVKRETDMLYQGDPVKILGSVDGWYYISTDNGSNGLLHGYVSKSYITVGKNDVQKINYSATQGQVKAGMTAWINYSPSKTDNKEAVSGGTSFTIIGNANDYWYEIQYYGGTGWISYKMVDVW